MNVQAVVFVVIYMLIALGIGVILSLALGAGLHVETKLRSVLIPVMFPLIVLGIMVSVVLSGRSLAVVGLELVEAGIGVASSDPTQGARATWPLRITTLLILAASFSIIFGSAARRRAVRPGIPLIAGFALYFVSNVVLNSAFGTEPQFQLNHYYPVFVFTAVYLARELPPDDIIRFGKQSLLAIVAISVLMLGIKRSLVLQQPYLHGWLPGVKVRFWGLTSHANAMGSLALLYLLLEVHSHSPSRWQHWVGLAFAFVALVLAQSKTAWVVGVILVGLLLIYRLGPQWRADWRAGRSDGRLMVFLLVLIVCVLFCLGLPFFVDVDKYWNRFINSDAGSQVLSLSGRGAIWDVAVNVWKENPLFGYGPKLWDADFRQSIGLSFAFNAHNQFLQSLSSAGTVGAIGLLAYVFILGWYGLRYAVATSGLTLALFLFLLIRCATETPLSVGTLFNDGFFTHLLVFAYFVRVAALQRAVRVAGAARVNLQARTA